MPLGTDGATRHDVRSRSDRRRLTPRMPLREQASDLARLERERLADASK